MRLKQSFVLTIVAAIECYATIKTGAVLKTSEYLQKP